MSFKKILSNQTGVSLVEVIAASAISIIIAMGVMQINENASKGMKDIQAQSDIINFTKMVKARLSQDTTTNPDTCFNAVTAAMGTSNISANRTISGSLNTGLASEPEFTINQQLLSAPQWRVTSARVTAFANNAGGVVGECNIQIELEKRNKLDATGSGNQQSSGVQARSVTIPMTCTVNDASSKVLTSCSPRMDVGGAGDSFWGTESVASGTALTFEGLGGNPMVVVGAATGTAGFGGTYPISAALTLDPIKSGGQDWSPPAGTGGTPTHAIAIPLDSAITFGNNDELALYNDTPRPNRLMLANSTGNAELLVGTSVSGTLIGQTSVTTTNFYGSNYYYTSDERFKKDIHTIEDASEKLSELRGVTYFMRKDEFPSMNFPSEMQVGLIAQEVEKVFPELVSLIPTKEGGQYKSIQYANLVAVLIEAFKEQKDEIIKNRELLAIMQNGMTLKDNEQDSRIESLEAENKVLRSRIEKLEKAVEELIKNKED